MKLLSVKSSHLRAVGYDRSSETMLVEFANGATYSYPGVPLRTFNKLMLAPSKGEYFLKQIRPHFKGSKH